MTERHTDYRDLPPSVAAKLRLHDAKAAPKTIVELADEARAKWALLHGKTAA